MVTPAMPSMRMEGAAALVELVEDFPADVPLSFSAKFWNAVKLRADVSSEFTANTMPAPQWLAGFF